MGLAGFCSLLWRLTGHIDTFQRDVGVGGMALILIGLKLFIGVVLAKQGLLGVWYGE